MPANPNSGGGVDPLAVWGAVTGTAGLGLTAWREFRGRKRSLRVDHGWQFAQHHRDGQTGLYDIFMSVSAYNTGRRPLHIHYCGWRWLAEGPRNLADEVGVELGPDNRVWVPQSAEIALNGETLEVVPDGPAVKIWTRIGGLLALDIEPGTPVMPFVVTVPDVHWFGPEVPLLPAVPQDMTAEDLEDEAFRLRVDWMDAHDASGFSADQPRVHALQPLIMEGSVERTTDVLPRDGRDDQPPVPPDV